MSLADTYDELSQHQEALKCRQDALSNLLEVHGEAYEGVALCYYAQAYSYGELGQHQVALEWLQRALAILREVHGETHEKVASCYCLLADTHGELGQHEKALEHAEKALEVAEAVKDKEFIVAALSCLGEHAAEMGQDSRALKSWRAEEKLLRKYDSVGDKEALAMCLVNQAELLLARHEKPRRIVALAEEAAECLEGFDNSELRLRLEAIHRALAANEANQGPKGRR